MQTRDGRKVENLTYVEAVCKYVGKIDGKTYTWHNNGKLNKSYKSRLDLVDQSIAYLNVRKWSGRVMVTPTLYFSRTEAVKNAGNGYIKTIKIDL